MVAITSTFITQPKCAGRCLCKMGFSEENKAGMGTVL